MPGFPHPVLPGVSGAALHVCIRQVQDSDVLGLLKEKALACASAIWDCKSLVSSSFVSFSSKRKEVFNQLVCGTDAAERLLTIC